MEPGQLLFSDLINSIRATTELEQAKSDRDLQDHIQAVGVGIAAGAIVASSSGLITQPWYYRNGEPMELPFTPPHPFLIGFFGSIICSIGAWQLAEGWIKKGRPKDQWTGFVGGGPPNPLSWKLGKGKGHPTHSDKSIQVKCWVTLHWVSPTL